MLQSILTQDTIQLSALEIIMIMWATYMSLTSIVLIYVFKRLGHISPIIIMTLFAGVSIILSQHEIGVWLMVVSLPFLMLFTTSYILNRNTRKQVTHLLKSTRYASKNILHFK